MIVLRCYSTIMADSLTPLLLDAKKEYLTRLYEIVAPSISLFMQTMYHSDISRNRYLTFQKNLSQIPFWNTYIIQEKTAAITRQFPFFENLMAACIVTYVKVLSSIRLSSDRPSIKLKLPTIDVFVHELYKQTAQTLYYDPFIMDCGIEKLHDTIYDSIERAIRRLIPFDDILSSYLAAGGPDTTQNFPASPTGSHSSSSSSSSSDGSVENEAPINVPMTRENTVYEQRNESFGDDDDNDDGFEPQPPQSAQPPVFPPQTFPSPPAAAPAPAPAPPTAPEVPSVVPSNTLTHPAPGPPQQPSPPPQPQAERKYPFPPAAPGQLVPSVRESF